MAAPQEGAFLPTCGHSWLCLFSWLNSPHLPYCFSAERLFRNRYKKAPSFLSIHIGIKADVLPPGSGALAVRLDCGKLQSCMRARAAELVHFHTTLSSQPFRSLPCCRVPPDHCGGLGQDGGEVDTSQHGCADCVVRCRSATAAVIARCCAPRAHRSLLPLFSPPGALRHAVCEHPLAPRPLAVPRGHPHLPRLHVSLFWLGYLSLPGMLFEG